MEDYRSGTCGCAGPGASSGGATTVSIFLGDQVLAEYDNGVLPSAPTNEYIYAGGQRVMSEQSGVTDYWHYDHLSPRLRTDASGNVADQRGTFPFGESWYSPGQSPYMFTTYYRDYESGNDYAQARSYISRLARFSSPDPVPGSASDPQSLNAYSYVESDPANLADPLGLCPSPGICITVSAPYWPSGPSLPSTSAVFFGGAGPDDINAEGQIFARTGRGNSSSAAANNGFHVQRTFQRTFQCSSSASGVMNALESNFASFANNPASGNFSTFSIFTPGPASPGGQIGIDVGVQVGGHTIGYSDVSVTVQSATSSQLVFQSDPGHVLYPATVSFSASDAGNGSITFTTSVNATTNGLWGTAQFYLLGGRAGETSTWNNLLNNVAGFCAQPSHP